MKFCKNLKLENEQMYGDKLFSVTNAMIPYDLYPLSEEPGNVVTQRYRND